MLCRLFIGQKFRKKITHTPTLYPSSKNSNSVHSNGDKRLPSRRWGLGGEKAASLFTYTGYTEICTITKFTMRGSPLKWRKVLSKQILKFSQHAFKSRIDQTSSKEKEFQVNIHFYTHKVSIKRWTYFVFREGTKMPVPRRYKSTFSYFSVFRYEGEYEKWF